MNKDNVLWTAQLADLLKTDNSSLLSHLLSQVSLCTWKKEEVSALNLTLAAVAGIGPRDHLEALLAVQMVAVHNTAMELLRRTMIHDQSAEGVDAGVQRATRLMRLFTTQMEALLRYRGGGKQAVTVQHVQVDAGDQAIVGTVHHSPIQTEGGGGETQK